MEWTLAFIAIALLVVGYSKLVIKALRMSKVLIRGLGQGYKDGEMASPKSSLQIKRTSSGMHFLEQGLPYGIAAERM